MKKIIATLLSFVMAFSLCACGNSEEINAVEGLIDEIGVVSIDSGEAIASAQTAFYALTEKDREKVKNEEVLKTALEEFEVAQMQFAASFAPISVDVITEMDMGYGLFSLSYEFDERGRISACHTKGIDGYLTESDWLFSYNDDGTFAQISKYHSGGSWSYSYDYNITNSGWTVTTVIDKEKETVNVVATITDMKLDDNGYIVSGTKCHDSDGEETTYDVTFSNNCVMFGSGVKYYVEFDTVEVPANTSDVIKMFMNHLLVEGCY